MHYTLIHQRLKDQSTKYIEKKKDTPSKTHEQKHQPGLQQIIDPSKPVYAGAKAELLDKCNNQHIHKRDT